jgi:hypothetical protein
MSDAYYQERARRRARIYWLAGLVAAVVLVVLVGLWALFHDACTRSFDRSPASVVSAYLTAVGQGNAPVAQECWEHDAYFDLNAGCSEICLSKVYGAQFEVQNVSVGEPATTPEGRANLPATVSIACAAGGETHTAEILLDSVSSNVPWKHWAIVHSTFGGTVVEPWCK